MSALKLALLIYLAIKLGLISKEILTFLPTSINSLLDYFRTQGKEEIIELEHLPFDIQIPKRKQIRLPSWLGSIISVVGINKLNETEIRKILTHLVSLTKNAPERKTRDEKLIQSILKELDKLGDE